MTSENHNMEAKMSATAYVIGGTYQWRDDIKKRGFRYERKLWAKPVAADVAERLFAKDFEAVRSIGGNIKDCALVVAVDHSAKAAIVWRSKTCPSGVSLADVSVGFAAGLDAHDEYDTGTARV